MPCPAKRSVSCSRRSQASIKGDKSISCEPMWQSIPTMRKWCRLPACRYACSASAMAMPNLLAFRPVEIYGWVLASTSGLMRSETGAVLPSRCATALILSNSGRLSTLKHLMPAFNANSISTSLLPTPEKMILSALPPAASTRAISPPETVSKPLPSRAKCRMMLKLLLALTA